MNRITLIMIAGSLALTLAGALVAASGDDTKPDRQQTRRVTAQVQPQAKLQVKIPQCPTGWKFAEATEQKDSKGNPVGYKCVRTPAFRCQSGYQLTLLKGNELWCQSTSSR